MKVYIKVRVVARAKGYLDSLHSMELEVVVSFTDQKPYMISSKRYNNKL